MTNPFDDVEAHYHVLVNEEGQYSLWPVFVPTPSGWTRVHENDSRESCLRYVNEHWTDLRPASLIDSMTEGSRS